ncbi:hypothetical protein BU24DRAFT_58866 [Aaosphaeria arxii CBS 175.79]|uniref:Mediator of RNA polymerase II transcription subunit 21 n=1 Tax=Aaosphaeria arxii CBS 175.79 TaxID=1450172 RepID=A0A6A5XBL1_9PLEO|nr:uncharacterized protein BU24DRAFT_58866 [Aaosphaeria arxii CBS 175.79]KAF2010465.1 hypothetical protein BU24DRAFT_58866 [Aaosphaeria arxii CBS 175.79]
MGDILTQIQDELDMLLNQMFITLRYIQTSSPSAPITGQPTLPPLASDPSQPDPNTNPANPPTTSKAEFTHQIAEFAQDIVTKEQQLEILFDALPGMGISEKEQRERMEALQGELEGVEEKRREAGAVREGLVEKVERGIIGVRGG